MNRSKDIIKLATRALEVEADAIIAAASRVGSELPSAVDLIFKSKGRLVVSGIGKSALVGQKIVATMNSTGTPSLFLHAADAIHGDLGMVQADDVVLILSQSGNTPEIKVLLPLLKSNGNSIIAICGQESSFLGEHADIVLSSKIDREACPLNLAPTTSTAVQMSLGDALAVCLIEHRGFSSQDFAKYHPGGSLGKKLYLRVSDLLSENLKPMVSPSSGLPEVILEISSGRVGAAVVMEGNSMLGVITDGDLRRMLTENEDWTKRTAKEVMSLNPKTIESHKLAIEALEIMKENSITNLPVLKNGEYQGFIHIHDLMREGLL